jgi:hypothetical protein
MGKPGITFPEMARSPGFKITVCDLESSTSSAVSWNMKSSGK